MVISFLAGILLFLVIIHYLFYIVSHLWPLDQRSQQMQTEEAKYIKKKLKCGTLEPHPTEKAIIINYKLEATVLGSKQQPPMLEEKKDCQRIIRLKSLNSKTDPSVLAKEVVDKCELIHRSQLQDIEQIIYYLKNRKDTNDGSTQRTMSRSADKISMAPEAKVENATICNIDEYIELLYEDIKERIRGSALILQLARNPDNLEELENNEAVLSALSRVLREDWRKSIDLSTNIIYIFFCFSTYTQFHPVIVQHKIGSLCMDVIDYELKRYEQMKNDLEVRRNPDANKLKDQTLNRSHEGLFDTIMNEEKPREMEPPRRRIPELKQRPKSGNWSSYHGGVMSSSLTKAHSMNNSYHENLAKETVNGSTETLQSNNGSVDEKLDESKADPRKQKDEYDKQNKQLKLFAKKQEQLLRVAFYLLLNIAENVKLEEKMRRKNIIGMLVKAVERQNIDLLVLIVTFLKKLSIVRDNKDEMHELMIVDKLPMLLHSSHPDLIQVTLKLLYNLSFDGKLRARMVRVGILPKLVTFLSDDKHHGIVTKILYHLSLDDKVKSMFFYTDCIPIVTDMLLLNLNQKSELDLVGLGINLALNKGNAQLMVENNRLHSMMARAFKFQDALLMKMIRNIAQHESLRPHFIDFVGDLAKVLTVCDDEAFVVECIGILGNISLPDLDFSQILQNFNLVQWIRNLLIPSKVKDDLVLETVVFLGTCACDESCAMLLCKADIMISLIELLKAKQEDDEVVLQIVFVFQQVLRNESTRGYMIKETETPAYLIDLMHDKNSEIRAVCDFCLDVIATVDNNWASRIKLEKFRNHNSQWLDMVESQQANEEEAPDFGPLDDDDEDGVPPYYMNQYSMDMINDSNDEVESNARTNSGLSNHSRPISRYSRDLEDVEIITANEKLRHSDGGGFYTNNLSNGSDNVGNMTEPYLVS